MDFVLPEELKVITSITYNSSLPFKVIFNFAAMES